MKTFNLFLMFALFAQNLVPIPARHIANAVTDLQSISQQAGIETEPPVETPTETPVSTETPTPVINTPTPTETPATTETPTPVNTPTSSVTPIPTVTTVPGIVLSLLADPQVVLPGETVTIIWQIEGVETLKEDAFLRFHAPSGFKPMEDGTAKFEEKNNTYDVLIDSTSGKMVWNVDSKAELPAFLAAELWQGGEAQAKVEVELLARDENLIDARGGEVAGMGGRVRVKFPEGSAAETLQVKINKPSKEALPVASLSGSPFEITSVSEQSSAKVSSFQKPVEIQVQYNEGEQSGNEENILLYWYDPTDGQWKFPLSQRVDTENNLIIATTDHFTVFDTYNSNWQRAETPTMDYFQTSQFTGAASFSMPIKVPPGPGGFQPSLALSYSSMTADSVSNYSQASWVGMGWSLDTSYIELNSNGTQGWDSGGNPKTGDDTYSFNLNGVSSALYFDPATGRYRSANENFYKFQYNATAQTWTVWDKSGTQYIFSRLTKNFVWQSSECTYVQLPWRWSLTAVKNNFGQEIEYTYAAETKDFAYFDCDGSPHIKTSESWVYPESIVYANNRYRIFFDRIEETELAKYPRKDLKTNWTQPITHEAFQRSLLEAIRVEQDSNGDGTFETLIRKYKFTYCQEVSCNIFPKLVWEQGGRTPTLFSIQEFGLGGTQGLPAYTFTYGDKMHLTSASNGYGATITYQYNNSTNALAPQNAWHDVEGGNPLKYDSSLTGWEGCVAPHYENGRISGADVCGLAQNTQVDSYQPGRWYEIKARVQSSVAGRTPTVQLGYAYKENGVLSPTYLDPGVTLSANRSWRVVQSQPFFLPVNATQIIPKIKSSNGFTHVSWYYLVPLPTYSRVTSRTISTGSNSYTNTYSYTGAATNSPSISAAAAGTHPYVEPYTEFRGHSQVVETNPYGGQTITKFHRDDIFAGRAYEVTVKDNLGRKIQQSTTSFDSQEWPAATLTIEECDVVMECGLPYDQLYIRWVRTDSETKTVFDSNGGTAGSLTTTYGYNENNGNLIEQTVSGSIPHELTTHYHYYSNTSGGKYIIGFPDHIWVTTGGSTLAESINIYGSINPGNSDAIGLQTTRTLITSEGQYSQMDFGYDGWGNVTSQTAYSGYYTGSGIPSGARTLTTVYDAAYHTYPISQTTPPVDGFPSGLTTTWRYDYDDDGINDFILGVPTRETGPNGVNTKIEAEYDTFGRLTKLIRPGDDSASPTLQIAYSTSPFTVTLTQKVEAGQFYNVTRAYDGMGRPTSVTAGGVTTLYDYGFENGQRMDKVSMPNSSDLWVKTVYDALGRPASVTAPDGTTITSVYDGLQTTVTDAKGNATTTVADILGHTVSVDAADGPDLAFAYSALGNLETATRGDAVVTMNYDIAGRKTSMDDPDMGHWTYQYDALGNLRIQTDARGCTLSMEYDNLNRIDTKTSSGGNCGQHVSVNYNYDAGTYGKGFRTSMEDGTSTLPTSWEYDYRGRLVKEIKHIDSQSFTTQWTYNQADMPKTMIYPDGEEVTYDYNARLLLESVIGANTYVSNTAYDSAGRMTSRALGNGLTQTFNYYDWNEQALVDGEMVGQGGRLETLTTGTLQNLGYLYDAVGNVKQIVNSEASETSTYGYDLLNRLTSWQLNENPVVNYNYNAAGNLIEKGDLDLEYNDTAHVHAVTDAGSNSYDYDQNGNQTHRLVHTIVNGQPVTQEFEMGYDAENRLVSVTGVNGTTTSAQFTYNGDGQKVKSVINGETTLLIGGHYEQKGSQITKYYFAGASRIAMRKYTIPQSMTVEYMLGDHLGSTSITTDNTGAIASEMRYEPWGEIRYSWTANQSTTPAYKLPVYTFTGQRSYMDDPSTSGMEGFGLMDYNARMYDPQVGRFAQADTIVPGGVQGLDRYAYVNNSPVNYIDPTGHMCSDPDDPNPTCDGSGNYPQNAQPLPNVTWTVQGEFDDILETKGPLAAIYWLADYYNIKLPPGNVWAFTNSDTERGINPTKTENRDGYVLFDSGVYITNLAFGYGDFSVVVSIMLHEDWHAWVEHFVEAKPKNRGEIPPYTSHYDADLFGDMAWEVDADNAALAAVDYGVPLSPLAVDMRESHRDTQGFPDAKGSANTYIETIYGITLPSYSVMFGQ